MKNLSNILIVIICLVVAIPITRLLVKQISVLFNPNLKPYLYLSILTVPVYEIIRLATTTRDIFLIPFTYFWILFGIALLILFITERKQ